MIFKFQVQADPRPLPMTGPCKMDYVFIICYNSSCDTVATFSANFAVVWWPKLSLCSFSFSMNDPCDADESGRIELS